MGLGSLYVFVAATLGAIASFLIGRYLVCDWIGKKIAGNEKFIAIAMPVKIIPKTKRAIANGDRFFIIYTFNLQKY